MNETFDRLISSLNTAQREAVETIDGAILVVAGPGTGKTQLLAMRVANILQNTDTLPNSILCLTFTDAAASNMRTRLRQMIGLEAQKVAIHTFHSLGTEIINQNPEYFYKGARYEPADELAKITIIETILQNLDYNDPLKSYHPDFGWTYRRDIIDRIGDLKQAGLTPLEFKEILDEGGSIMEEVDPAFQALNNVSRVTQITTESFGNFLAICFDLIEQFDPKTRVLSDTNKDNPATNYMTWKELFNDDLRDLAIELKVTWNTTLIKNWRDKWGRKDDLGNWHLKDCLNLEKQYSLARIYEEYQSNMHQQGLFDFDDMLLDVVEGFRKNPALGYRYQEKFLYIMVDEFQDTNGVQMSMIDNLIDLEVSEGRPNLLAVGDDDQAIYKFQRATIENILNFKEKYIGVKIITLTENYRSTQDILDLAQNVIEQSQIRLADLPEVTKILKSNNVT